MKIAVLYGANSLEHEISILSALQIRKHFTEDEVILVYMSKSHHFYVGECLKEFDFYRDCNVKRCKEVEFVKKNTEVYLKEKGLFGKKTEIEMVFPMMHGAHGEDGCIQGYLELLNIPYAQSTPAVCALLMDKDLMRKMFLSLNIPMNEGVTLHKGTILCDLKLLNDIQISKPWIIKPARSGSSIGINVIENEDQMHRLICESFCFDSKLILEKKLEKVREFNVAVMGNASEQIISNIEEILINHDYYSYTDKYGGSFVKQHVASRVLPAMIEDSLKEEIITLSKKAFVEMECSGVVRFDYFYTDQLLLNEINAIPGSLSMYLFKDICTPSEMINVLKKCAMDKHMSKLRTLYSIDSFIFKKDNEIHYLKQ